MKTLTRTNPDQPGLNPDKGRLSGLTPNPDTGGSPPLKGGSPPVRVRTPRTMGAWIRPTTGVRVKTGSPTYGEGRP